MDKTYWVENSGISAFPRRQTLEDTLLLAIIGLQDVDKLMLFTLLLLIDFNKKNEYILYSSFILTCPLFEVLLFFCGCDVFTTSAQERSSGSSTFPNFTILLFSPTFKLTGTR